MVALTVLTLLAPTATVPRVDAQGPVCPAAPTDEVFTTIIRGANLVLIGSVVSFESDRTATDLAHVGLKPESFLKGSPSAANFEFLYGPPELCESFGPKRGERFLLVVSSVTSPPGWPFAGQVFRLESGNAVSSGKGDARILKEADLVARIRSQTNQFSQPASSSGSGAAIDWGSTVLPIGAACAALLVVGLFLMRIWHRIDPS